VLGVLHAPDLSGFKAGIIVPKALGNAVLRNRTKRRLRQIIRRSAPRIGPHLKLVMLARRGTAEADPASLEKDWLELAHKAGILNAPTLA
jgi:ribonuclease P protein component